MEQIKTELNGRTGKIMNWASILESNTFDQAVTTSTMPFIFPHLALMPDAHLGKGATVGSVIPTLGAIIPAAVGVDIGCGMMAVRTQFTLDNICDRFSDQVMVVGGAPVGLGDELRRLHAEIARRIPLSAGKYNQKVEPDARSRVDELQDMDGSEQADEISSNWELQLGSLGSGNHFIEVSLDERNRVWLFLHSGSRGVGNKLATKWIKVAQEQCLRRYIDLPDRDLAYLVEGDDEFWGYMEALRWAQRFAYLNREVMMDRVASAFQEWFGEGVIREETVNCHHNYTEQAMVFGCKVWLSRKGAISAKEGELGLIPGSMGDRSYVVRGRGNPLSLESAPHGAGRNHSRSAAKKLFTREDLDARMHGVAWGESDAFIDEHPLAYKDIDIVMEDAKSLVEPVHTLRQIVNVKGD